MQNTTHVQRGNNLTLPQLPATLQWFKSNGWCLTMVKLSLTEQPEIKTRWSSWITWSNSLKLSSRVRYMAWGPTWCLSIRRWPPVNWLLVGGAVFTGTPGRFQSWIEREHFTGNSIKFDGQNQGFSGEDVPLNQSFDARVWTPWWLPYIGFSTAEQVQCVAARRASWQQRVAQESSATGQSSQHQVCKLWKVRPPDK